MKNLLIILSIIINAPVMGQSFTSYFTGNPSDTITFPDGGICMMGGGSEHDEAMKWFLQRANGGDIIVLRASGSDGYNDYMFTELGISVNSVETIVFNYASASNDNYIHTKIKDAEAIWFAGGDQWDYVSLWRNTPIDSLINEAIQKRNIVIGGTSAGMAILGGFYFSAQKGTVTSQTALANPYDYKITVDSAFFIVNNYLTDIITDTHYDNRDRKGRHVVFLARILSDYGILGKGIACNEKTAVCVDKYGIATVYGRDSFVDECAYFIQANCEIADVTPEDCSAAHPLDWNHGGDALKVYKVNGTNNGLNTFDLSDWKTGTGGSWENWYVDNGYLIEEPGTQIDCSVLSINYLKSKAKIRIFPNPVKDTFSIIMDEKIVSVSIFDIEGIIRYKKKKINNNKIELDISNWNTGIYLLKIESTAKTYSKKIIKE